MPGHAEALGDVGTNLRAKPQGEAPARIGIEIMPLIGQGHGAAGKGYSYACLYANLAAMLSGQQQWEEGVVIHLGGADTVITFCFQLLYMIWNLVPVRGQVCINFHVALLLCC